MFINICFDNLPSTQKVLLTFFTLTLNFLLDETLSLSDKQMHTQGNFDPIFYWIRDTYL